MGRSITNGPRIGPNRVWRGLASVLGAAGVPLGSWWCANIDHLQTPARLEQGLVLILPGIEGRSAVNLGLARGLEDGRVPFAIEICDWTTGVPMFMLYHLRAARRHRREALRVAERIASYQHEYPGRPTFLIGHSGGCGVALYALTQLTAAHKVTGVLLLAAAVSPSFDLATARQRTERGIWSFNSFFDWFQLGLCTLTFGTIDRKHTLAAGMVGFGDPSRGADEAPTDAPIHQQAYELSMARSWNFGGHLAATNRLFAAERLAPILRNDGGASSPR